MTVASLEELLSTRGLLALGMKDELDQRLEESRDPAIEDLSDVENKKFDHDE